MRRLLFFISLMFAFACSSENGNTSKNQTFANGTSVAGKPVEYHIPYSENTINPKENKRVLVICASPRKGGNTDLLCDEFIRGAKEVSQNVEKVFLADYDLNFIPEEDATSPKDNPHTSDAWKLTEKFLLADVVVFASPVYYMNVTDRMKAFFDATFLAFGDERSGGKEYYYITACAQANDSTAETAFYAMRGFVFCQPSGTERGYVKAIGVGAKAAVKNSQYMQQAYQLGQSINK